MSESVAPNLFIPVAHFHFENFQWPYSRSIAQELDPNFHQTRISLNFFRPKTGNLKKKGFTKIQTVFPTEDINSSSCKYDFFKPKCSVTHCKMLLWPLG